MPHAAIVYCSPAGSTRHVAKIIEKTLASLSVSVTCIDLGQTRNAIREFNAVARQQDCLFIGSPVYRDVATPPVMGFIDALAPAQDRLAVPFVTWGGAISGIALWQMGRALEQKGYQLAGGAKVLGRHAMMWNHPHPQGAGHPDAEDERLITELVREIGQQLASPQTPRVSLSQFDYLPAEWTSETRAKMGQPWKIIPKSVDEERCTQCGTCEAECPVGAVSLSPYPQFAENCFDCFNCIRLCPEEAIISKVPMEKIHAMILERVEKFNERPGTQIFLSQ
ncbi:MAG: EFR1 family ferrodoxin [Desulfobacterales bacterium]